VGLLVKAGGVSETCFCCCPHTCMLQVCGLIGVLGRVPLHQQDILLPTSNNSNSSQRPHQHHSRSSSAASLSTAAAAAAAADGDAGGSSSGGLRPEGGRPLGDRARGVLAASATHLDRLVLGSARKLGRSITQDSLLRLFGSAGASLQVGEMRGNFFDFTRVEAVLDLGLNGPESLVQAPAPPAAAAGGAAGKSSGVGRNRTRAGAAPAKAAGSRGSGGTVRSASPARGMATILGPAAAAAHAAAAAQPPLPPSAAAGVVGSSDGSPRSSTIGSNASGAAGHLGPTAGSSSAPAAASAAALPLTGAAAAGGGSSGVASSSSTGRHKHPAFALDERGVWHSLTLSATQQLFGPVRLRADARLALDSVNPCPRGAGGRD
jgi:hypothetical protein